MILLYTFSDIGKNNLKSKAEAIKATDEGAQGMRECIQIIAKALGTPRFIIWLMTRSRRTITREYVEYDFYILRWMTRLGGEKVDELQRNLVKVKRG